MKLISLFKAVHRMASQLTLKENGLSYDDILKIKIWWCRYPTEPLNDQGSIDIRRNVIQNDDENPGSCYMVVHLIFIVILN